MHGLGAGPQSTMPSLSTALQVKNGGNAQAVAQSTAQAIGSAVATAVASASTRVTTTGSLHASALTDLVTAAGSQHV